MSRPWYPAASPPVAGHPVEIAWTGHQTPGWYEAPTYSQPLRWVSASPGRRPRSLRVARGEVVTHWRPIDGDAYAAPLPSPDPFAIVAAVASPQPAVAAVSSDPTPSGLVPFERRIQRAIRTLLSLPDRERYWLTNQTNWPFEMLTTRADLNDRQGNAAYLAELELERLSRFRPTPEDLADMHSALGHFNALSLPPEQRIKLIRAGRQPFSPPQRLIWWRTRGLSFSLISKKLGGITDEAARRRYWRAIEDCEAAVKTSVAA